MLGTVETTETMKTDSVMMLHRANREKLALLEEQHERELISLLNLSSTIMYDVHMPQVGSPSPHNTEKVLSSRIPSSGECTSRSRSESFRSSWPPVPRMQEEATLKTCQPLQIPRNTDITVTPVPAAMHSPTGSMDFPVPPVVNDTKQPAESDTVLGAWSTSIVAFGRRLFRKTDPPALSYELLQGINDSKDSTKHRIEQWRDAVVRSDQAEILELDFDDEESCGLV